MGVIYGPISRIVTFEHLNTSLPLSLDDPSTFYPHDLLQTYLSSFRTSDVFVPTINQIPIQITCGHHVYLGEVDRLGDYIIRAH